jgi:hypothetical protein
MQSIRNSTTAAPDPGLTPTPLTQTSVTEVSPGVFRDNQPIILESAGILPAPVVPQVPVLIPGVENPPVIGLPAKLKNSITPFSMSLSSKNPPAIGLPSKLKNSVTPFSIGLPMKKTR